MGLDFRVEHILDKHPEYREHIFHYRNVQNNFYPRISRSDYKLACNEIEERLLNESGIYAQGFTKYMYEVFEKYKRIL